MLMAHDALCAIRLGCTSRLVTIPYAASSDVSTPALIGGQIPEKRDVPFFFAGSSRHQPDRENLVVGGDDG